MLKKFQSGGLASPVCALSRVANAEFLRSNCSFRYHASALSPQLAFLLAPVLQPRKEPDLSLTRSIRPAAFAACSRSFAGFSRSSLPIFRLEPTESSLCDDRCESPMRDRLAMYRCRTVGMRLFYEAVNNLDKLPRPRSIDTYSVRHGKEDFIENSMNSTGDDNVSTGPFFSLLL